MNWDHIRSVRFTKEPTPQDWPEDIRGISIEGVSLLGVHEKTGKLYWDGKEIRTRNMILLGTYERWWPALRPRVLSARSLSISGTTPSVGGEQHGFPSVSSRLSAWCPKGQFISRRVGVKIGGFGEHGG